jgi:hypothetical protein
MPGFALLVNSELSKYFQFYKSVKASPILGYNALRSDFTAVHFIEQTACLICAREGQMIKIINFIGGLT